MEETDSDAGNNLFGILGGKGKNFTVEEERQRTIVKETRLQRRG